MIHESKARLASDANLKLLSLKGHKLKKKKRIVGVGGLIDNMEQWLKSVSEVNRILVRFRESDVN